jgi:hypothetical protein
MEAVQWRVRRSVGGLGARVEALRLQAAQQAWLGAKITPRLRRPSPIKYGETGK